MAKYSSVKGVVPPVRSKLRAMVVSVRGDVLVLSKSKDGDERGKRRGETESLPALSSFLSPPLPAPVFSLQQHTYSLSYHDVEPPEKRGGTATNHLIDRPSNLDKISSH